MTLTDFGIVIAILTGLVSLAGVIYGSIWKTAQIELKLDIIWSYIMERGMASMITSGLGTLNSPLIISDEAIAWFAPMEKELKSIYKKYTKLDDYKLGFEIQKSLGDRMLREICIPHKITNGECLLIAVAVAKS